MTTTRVEELLTASPAPPPAIATPRAASRSLDDPSLYTNPNVHHPIGVVYDTNLVKKRPFFRLYDPTTRIVTIGVDSLQPKQGKIADVMLYSGASVGGTKVECSSCHDVHNGVRVKDLYLVTGLISGSDRSAGGYICTQCHIK